MALAVFLMRLVAVGLKDYAMLGDGSMPAGVRSVECLLLADFVAESLLLAPANSDSVSLIQASSMSESGP
jgi:hypothetical protein